MAIRHVRLERATWNKNKNETKETLLDENLSHLPCSLFNWTRKLHSLFLWLPGSPVMMVMTTFSHTKKDHIRFQLYLKEFFEGTRHVFFFLYTFLQMRNINCTLVNMLTLSPWLLTGFLSSAEGKSTPRWSYRMGSWPILLKAKCWRNLA